METKERIRDIISKTLDVDRKIINDDLSVGDIPQWDSMGNIAIIAALEEAFQVEFPMEDLFELTSIDGFASYIEKLI